MSHKRHGKVSFDDGWYHIQLEQKGDSDPIYDFKVFMSGQLKKLDVDRLQVAVDRLQAMCEEVYTAYERYRDGKEHNGTYLPANHPSKIAINKIADTKRLPLLGEKGLDGRRCD